MIHNRKQCIALYLEEEYEQLVLECYWTARAKVKMPNNRYRFICIHCKESLKDKNTTSYHRMFQLCRVYEGTKPLKMYPTWDKSEQGEKQRIGLKFGKRDSPPTSSSPSPATRPPPLDLDDEAASTDCPDVVSAAESSPSQRMSRKRPFLERVADHCAAPPRKYVTKSVGAREKATPTGSTTPLPRKVRAPKPPLQPTRMCVLSEEHPHQVISTSESKSQSMDSAPSSPTSNSPVQAVEFKVVKHRDVLQSATTPPTSRQEVERQAWAEATRLFHPQNQSANPPPHQPINGLYILIAETDEQWAPRELLNDPHECMQYLHAQLEDGTIGQRIGNAFGQWYLYGNPTVCHSRTSAALFGVILSSIPFYITFWSFGTLVFQHKF